MYYLCSLKVIYYTVIAFHLFIHIYLSICTRMAIGANGNRLTRFIQYFTFDL